MNLVSHLTLSNSILTSWIIILILTVVCAIFTRKLRLVPGSSQVVFEGVFSAMEKAVQDVLPDHVDLVFPFIGTLWIYILVANLVGIIPGVSSPTSDLSVTGALAIIVFFSVHFFGIKINGWKKYFKHYLKPSPILLPFHLISEITRTLALAVRLFGNMMSLELTVLIILLIAGFLAPIPILMLHIIEACVQTYIFGMLALIYIAGGIQVQESKK